RHAELPGDLTKLVAAEDAGDLVCTYRHVLAGADPRRHLVTEPPLLELSDQPGEPARLLVVQHPENDGQQRILLPLLSATYGTNALVEQSHVILPNDCNPGATPAAPDRRSLPARSTLRPRRPRRSDRQRELARRVKPRRPENRTVELALQLVVDFLGRPAVEHDAGRLERHAQG